MSEAIKHECGIALVRLLKPLEYYRNKYGTALYGLNKLYLLMEKQHNRGHDGMGVASIKFDVKPGGKYISIQRSNSNDPIKDVFQRINKGIKKAFKKNSDKKNDIDWLKNNVRFLGELLLGHLRYGTFGKNTIDACHPFLRENNWMTRNLVLAGNFNLTNVEELFDLLVDIGQHPKESSDTVTILEKIGHFLDEENERLFREFKEKGHNKREISELIADHIDVHAVLHEACKKWDGGYVVAGLLGHGDAFVIRDPAGIRPAYYYKNSEIVVVTSERPPIQTAFNVPLEKVKELKPAHALVIKKNGKVSEKPFREPLEKKACSFERIYFSRGTDADIYKERKALGKNIVKTILKKIDYDLENTVFSFIPNTAETCFMGMLEELSDYCGKVQKEKLSKLNGNISPEKLQEILSLKPRFEKVAVKDAKLRTFITEDSARNDLVAHVYDVTYNSIIPEKDTLVIIDDSIVRGTTLKESILRILDRLGPKRILLISSAPQIRYPDCYGIDMAKLGDLVAFRAAVELLKESKRSYIIDKTYKKAKSQEHLPDDKIKNCVKDIYKPFTAEEISAKITKLLTPEGINAEVEIVYQTIEDLHKSCPQHLGDWYFTGDYPTPGGNRVVNRSYINFIEGIDERAY